jgi:hypothetical protein
MFGYRWCTDDEQLRLFDRLEDAIAHRKPVRVTYFKERKDVRGKRMTLPTGEVMYVKVTRVVEPYELRQTIAGRLVVHVMDRSPEGEERPASRTIRLDRIAFSRRQRKPLMNVMFSGRWLCPSPLDETDRIVFAT